jgi:RNA polymerase sporulation-specific sigma factor
MYKDENDFELVYLIEEKNEAALNMLYEKYKPIIEIKTKKYIKYASKLGLEYSDLFQEGMLGLSEAIKSFNVKKDVQFKTFANLCIERQIFTALKKASRKKHNVLNDSLSLDENLTDTETTLLDFIFDKNSDPSDYIESLETKKELFTRIDNELTPLEKEVFNLKINNLDYKEISLLLNKSYKSIDSAIQRIRLKVKKILKKIKNT